jgi:Flp pilus assembly CpaF family ATPase
MRVLVQNTLTNRQWLAFDGPAGFTIGRAEGCEVRLDSRFVSGEHARVERHDGNWEITLLPGVNAVQVDEKELGPGQKMIVRGAARMRIMEFVVALVDAEPTGEATAAEDALVELQNTLHANVLRRLDLRAGGWAQGELPTERIDQLNRIVDELLLEEFKSQVFDSNLTPVIIRRALRTRMSDWVAERLAKEYKISSVWNRLGINQDLETSVSGLLTRIAARSNIHEKRVSPADAEDLLDIHFLSAVEGVAGDMLENVRTYLIASYLKKLLYDMIFGLGPLEDLLRSPSITEVMVVSPSLIYIERNGRIMKVPQTFATEEAAVSTIERIVSPLGRRIDRSQPLVDARLRDGSRVNAIIEPLAVKGPCITIRKFPQVRVTVDDLIGWNSLTASAVELLRACILYRCNILVSGGTASGKTTLLNVLSGMIPSSERLVTVEDSAELRLQQEHVVTLETKPANAEGSGQFTVRDLVKNALRMRPDRVIVGECRGDESVDMLQAMNTGHRGSMTTIHSNGAADSVTRLETMVLMGADIPLQAVRRQISQAIHLIVHLDRMPDGRRMVSQISEVIGLHPTSGEVEVRDIMRVRDVNGTLMLRPTGFMPTFLDDLVNKGFLKLHSWFEQVRA